MILTAPTCGCFAEVVDFLRASHLPTVVSPDEMRLLHLGRFLDDSRKLSGTQQFVVLVWPLVVRRRVHGAVWCLGGLVTAYHWW